MPETRSINQNNTPKLLPNFLNLGTVLRIVLLVNGIALLGIASQANSLADLQSSFLQGSALLQPVLLTSLLMLYALNSVLLRVVYWQGVLAVSAIVAAVTVTIDILGGDLFFVLGDVGLSRYLRHALVGISVSLILLEYFRLRAQALSPAKQEARLQALQARIRPHFLFNTINAVLSIVRADPKRAETALEDMADLFRMAMEEPHELVALGKEVELARQYLAIEELRLGERLRVRWDTQSMPPDALIPPLILQPLLENAVYHGIEPLTEGGTIDVRLYLDGDEMHLEVSNPAPGQVAKHLKGNKMALSNIRERLSLLFDVEAQYQVEHDAEHYKVHILFPYVTIKAQSKI
jgi:two-component system sensor histidine kinase AlgZ